MLSADQVGTGQELHCYGKIEVFIGNHTRWPRKASSDYKVQGAEDDTGGWLVGGWGGGKGRNREERTEKNPREFLVQ